jgi:hypothetical protein
MKPRIGTTKEQSHRLMALGIPSETADCSYCLTGLDAWSLGALLEIIPKTIESTLDPRKSDVEIEPDAIISTELIIAFATDKEIKIGYRCEWGWAYEECEQGLIEGLVNLIEWLKRNKIKMNYEKRS